jgi:hypothetical protein
MQIEAEIYDIIRGKDLTPMFGLCYSMFKKRKLFLLSNEQLEILIPKLREFYDQRLSTKID